MMNAIIEFFKTDGLPQLGLAFLLGGLIGIEREVNHRPAGLRTHIVVTISACLAMLINFEIVKNFEGVVNVDPGRMGAYVISGIGFLGAGTIMKEGASISGLTTASSIWASAMIGLACGIKMYKISIFFTILVLFTLLLVNKSNYKIMSLLQAKNKTNDCESCIKK